MKKILFCVVAVAAFQCFLASTSSTAQAASMVTNGDFDSDLSGWSGGGPGSMSWDSAASPDGGCLFLQGPYEAYPTQSETLILPGDGTLYVSYTAWSPDTSGNLIVRVYNFDTGGWMSGSSIPKTTLHQGWDTYSFEKAIPASSDGHHFTVTFDSYQYGEMYESVFIDNVRVADTPIITLTPGDANGDGYVDVTDLGILATNYGVIGEFGWEDGDFTEDGAVDVSDLGILATWYGTVPTPQAAPEPAALAMLLGAIPSLCLLRRR